jgi:hypothetical protein
MEEQILEIIEANSAIGIFAKGERAGMMTEVMYPKLAKEITAHVFEFVEWLDSVNQHTGDIEKHYQYWLNNVKK